MSGRTWPWLLSAPFLLFLALFFAYPVGYAIYLAFVDPITGSWPSLGAFAGVAADSLFWRAALNNVLLPLLGVALELVAGLGLALFLNLRFRGRGALRLAVIVPFALPEIVFLLAARYVLAPHGYANAALIAAGLPPLDWLTPGKPLAFFTVAVVDAWHVTPVMFLMMLAALSALPDEVFDAARLDGAGRWSLFWRITLPLLWPAIIAALLLRGVDALRIFATPLVLTGVEGVPVLSTYAYHQWADYGNDAGAAAAAAALALLATAAMVPLLARSRREAL